MSVPIVKAIFKKSHKMFIQSYCSLTYFLSFSSTDIKLLVTDEIQHWQKPLKNEITFTSCFPQL